MQLLWINLVSDIFPVIALAVQPSDPALLERPPRGADDPFLRSQDARRIAREGLVITAGAMAAYGWGRWRYGPGPRASTMVFQSLTTAKLLHMLSARDPNRTLAELGAPTHPAFLGAFAGGLALQGLTLMVPPLRRLLGCAPVSPLDLVVAAAGAGLPLLVNDALKKRG
jgi:Ca2+-transporting ATPase